MVLHKNKWDRKAKKAHERKLAAKGETIDASNPRIKKEGSSERTKASETESRPNSETTITSSTPEVTSKGSTDPNTGAVQTGTDEASKDSDDESDESENGEFSRRKVQSNSWRYEEPEEDPYLKAEESEPEPEPDYARMTIGKDQVTFDTQHKKKPEEIEIEIDELFISAKPTKAPILREKGKAVKVDRVQFQDVNEKIAKQKTAEVFRQRFSSRKAHKNTEDVPDDMDEFLASLNQDELHSTVAAELPEYGFTLDTKSSLHGNGGGTSSGIQSSTIRVHSKVGSDSLVNSDKWLDDLLGGTSNIGVKGMKK